MYGCLSNTAAWVPATDCILFFAGPQQVNPQSWESLRVIQFVVKRISYFESHHASSAHSRFLYLPLFWFFFFFFFVIHWCTHIRTHKEKVHSMLSDCIAYLCHNQHIQAKPPQPLTFRKEMFLLIEIANDSHYFPTATSTACIYSFSLALGTDTKCDFQ